MRRHRGPLAFVLAAFVASRVAAALAGVRFDARQLGWAIQNVDPELLRHHLAESLWYLHGQPPLWNLFLGLVLKAAPGHETLVFHLVFLALGLVESFALYALLTRVGIPRTASAVLTSLVVASPAAVVYESWLFYDYPLLVALTVAALALHRFLERPTVRRGLVFFAVLAAVVLTRSAFQHVWLVLVLALLLGLRAAPPRTVLLAAALPLALVAGLYVKNAVVLGSPASSSWFGMNLSRITTWALPDAERSALARRGDLSGFALVPPFAAVGAYRDLVPVERRPGIPVLDEEYRSTGARNLEQVTYIRIAGHYQADARWVIRHRPGAYLHAVKRATELFFQSPTHLALLGRNPTRIGGWASVYDNGVYVARPETNRAGIATALLYFAAGLYGLLLLVHRRRDATGASLLFVWLTMIYVTATGTLTDLGENVRFRLPLDPIVLVLAAAAAAAVLAPLEKRLRFRQPDVEAADRPSVAV